MSKKKSKENLGKDLNEKVIRLSLNNWEVVYFFGKLYAQGDDLRREEWVKLRIKLNENDLTEDDMINIWIEDDMVSDELILYDFPKDINDSHPEVLKIIMEKI